ncbi:MAG: acyl-CoA thioesterase [Desulfovibrionaceae bacterium]
MNTYCLVRPEHLNHHGYLFGGSMLKWVDEYAWLTASLDFPRCPLVTMALNDIVFKERIKNGSILRFSVLPDHQGRTSMTYTVEVFADAPGDAVERLVFATRITFVHVGPDGCKAPLPARAVYRSQSPGSLPGAQALS